MKYTVNGYLEGVSYALVADSSSKDEDRGIVTQGPIPVIAAVEALTGRSYPITATGSSAKISLKDPLGLLVGLAQVTEITSIEGDLPPGWPGSKKSPELDDFVVH